VTYKSSSANLVRDAYHCFRKKRFNETVLLCEKLAAAFPREPYPLFLMALANLYTNGFDSADRAIEKILRIDPEYIPMIQLRAFLGLKSAPNLDSALKIYLDYLSRYPWDQRLIKARKMLGYTPNFPSLQKKARLTDLVEVPGPPRHMLKNNAKPKRPALSRPRRNPFRGLGFMPKAVFIMVFLLLFGLGAYLHFSEIMEYAHKIPVAGKDFSAVDRVNISPSEYDLISRINRDRTREFYVSVSEMAVDFERAKQLIKQEQYNPAVLLLNRIRNSNASFMVKEKASFLIDFIRNTDNREYDRPRYADVAGRRYLYHGYAVAWKGKVANMKRVNDAVSFTLLVDYRDTDVFSGTAEVYAPEKGAIENGSLVVVSGMVMDVAGLDRPYISARAVRRIP
jgi:hypothetical protein